MKRITIIPVFAVIFVISARGQSFMNLNFEKANISGYSQGYGDVPTEDAFPDWSAYFGTTSNPTAYGQLAEVSYDSLTTGGAEVSLQDSNAPAPYGPIQGYSALLIGSLPGPGEYTASLGQTGTIPSTAQSLTLEASFSGGLEVSFDGQTLSLVAISNAVDYTVYGANISAFAGQTGQLLFTAPVYTATLFDNIQFSTSPIPEPSALALCALGGLPVVWRWRKKSSA